MKKSLPAPRSFSEVGISFRKALQSLRLLIDPAVEGNPYVSEDYELKPKKSVERKEGLFGRRLSWR